jgi:hypothetical protein
MYWVYFQVQQDQIKHYLFRWFAGLQKTLAKPKYELRTPSEKDQNSWWGKL